MLNHKQIVLAVGAAVTVSALAMVPGDAHAWAVFGYRFPIDIIERIGPPSHKAPTQDARARRVTNVNTGQSSTGGVVRLVLR